jgi:hypothetical protein
MSAQYAAPRFSISTLLVQFRNETYFVMMSSSAEAETRRIDSNFFLPYSGYITLNYKQERR